VVKTICVYCGSREGSSPAIREAAFELGALMAKENIRLVYGGGSVGIMGIVADSVLDHGGEVIGVIPKGLFRTEKGHQRVTQLIEVASMHERKARMAKEADAFVALPGGLGTLEELAEIATWAQLGIHNKPVAVVNIENFWTPLLQFLDQAVSFGFLDPEKRAIVRDVDSVAAVLEALQEPLGPFSGPSLRPSDI